MRGEVLFYDEAGGHGLLTGEDGARYTFGRTELQSLTPVRAGSSVDFLPRDGVATGVFILQSPAQRSHVDRAEVDPISPWQYFTRCLSRYADGHGRARRKEYWYFILFQLLIVLVPAILCVGLSAAGGDTPSDASSIVIALLALITVAVYLALLIPGICVAIRRFHDVGLSGWLILLGLIPYAGGLITFVITLLPSQASPNKHGPVPAWSKRDTAEVFS